MGHYKSNLRDIEFNLFEVFDSGNHYGSAAYPEIDVETARTILTELGETFEFVRVRARS